MGSLITSEVWAASVGACAGHPTPAAEYHVSESGNTSRCFVPRSWRPTPDKKEYSNAFDSNAEEKYNLHFCRRK
ncbi:hypothetical protein KGM_207756 [Danaus plexippus plexippus]|uniref:Uncharacterized protein n=1 Tax=Danaus plexippus plexippus TaxID=278856 RepID=A0A212EYS1_DANPL|nr:hypothetical protein KGM_207756 [Danaus plexippus plexippus]